VRVCAHWPPCSFTADAKLINSTDTTLHGDENYCRKMVQIKVVGLDLNGKGKFVPVLNKASRHEDVWVSGSIPPFILSSFPLPPPTPPPEKRVLRYQLDGRLGRTQSRSGLGGEDKKSPFTALAGNRNPIVQPIA
jgi:hypothetical protein